MADLTKKKRGVKRLLFWGSVVAASGAAGFLAFYLTMLSAGQTKYEVLQQQAQNEFEASKNAVEYDSPDECANMDENSEESVEAEDGHKGNQSVNTDSEATLSEEASKLKEGVTGEQNGLNTDFVSSVDFVYLQSVNMEIYSWITIPDTLVDYPVLQHFGDQDYYLNHTYDDLFSWVGSIFSRQGSAKDLSDFLTVIYGHNLASGNMFGCLKEYRDEEYLMNHREITIYTPYSTNTYTIFAAVTYGNELLDTAFDLETESGRQALIDSLYEERDLNSHAFHDIKVTPDSQILVLSTCMGDSSKRFLIAAILTTVQK